MIGQSIRELMGDLASPFCALGHVIKGFGVLLMLTALPEFIRGRQLLRQHCKTIVYNSTLLL